MRICLGLDTSCYTTSLAAVDEEGRVVFDRRAGLDVPPGKLGLRQSEALFQHLKRLGPLAEQLRDCAGGSPVLCAAASTVPRPMPGSYLPVFLAGATAGRLLAAGAGARFFETSHQEGHLRAALAEASATPHKFLAFHLSGGTTEVLAATVGRFGYDLEILGGTRDLHAGQFIDRLGVAMDLPFPAGAALEELSAAGRPETVRLPVAVSGLHLSFSGPLAAAERALHRGVEHADLAAAALVCLTESVGRVLKSAGEHTGFTEAVLCGGVSANRRLRAELPGLLPGLKLTFARRELATDNAVGVALLALDRWREESSCQN